jgi:hypothetical protein
MFSQQEEIIMFNRKIGFWIIVATCIIAGFASVSQASLYHGQWEGNSSDGFIFFTVHGDKISSLYAKVGETSAVCRRDGDIVGDRFFSSCNGVSIVGRFAGSSVCYVTWECGSRIGTFEVSRKEKGETEGCSLSGYVTDKNTGLPVREANVKLVGDNKYKTETDTQGYYEFDDVECGTYKLKVKQENYEFFKEKDVEIWRASIFDVELKETDEPLVPENMDDDGDGIAENNGDCDDTDANIHPGAAEICGDGIDQDCNGRDVSCTDHTGGDGDDEDHTGGDDGDTDEGGYTDEISQGEWDGKTREGITLGDSKNAMDLGFTVSGREVTGFHFISSYSTVILAGTFPISEQNKFSFSGEFSGEEYAFEGIFTDSSTCEISFSFGSYSDSLTARLAGSGNENDGGDCNDGTFPIVISDIAVPDSGKQGERIDATMSYRGDIERMAYPMVVVAVPYSDHVSVSCGGANRPEITDDCKLNFSFYLPSDGYGTGTFSFRVVDAESLNECSDNWDDSSSSNILSTDITITK